jgi:hypothetical protein
MIQTGLYRVKGSPFWYSPGQRASAEAQRRGEIKAAAARCNSVVASPGSYIGVLTNAPLRSTASWPASSLGAALFSFFGYDFQTPTQFALVFFGELARRMTLLGVHGSRSRRCHRPEAMTSAPVRTNPLASRAFSPVAIPTPVRPR